MSCNIKQRLCVLESAHQFTRHLKHKTHVLIIEHTHWNSNSIFIPLYSDLSSWSIFSSKQSKVNSTFCTNVHRNQFDCWTYHILHCHACNTCYLPDQTSVFAMCDARMSSVITLCWLSKEVLPHTIECKRYNMASLDFPGTFMQIFSQMTPQKDHYDEFQMWTFPVSIDKDQSAIYW